MLKPQQIVRFAKIKTIRTPTTDWNLYEYRPELGWKWLQKVAFAALRWIGAHHMEVVTTFERHPQENNDLLKSLLGQQGAWIEFVHNDRKQPRIYMGPDDHADLMRLCDFRDMDPTTLYGRIETRDGRHYHGKLHDIPITVVPWMQGAIIVPH